MMDVSSLEKHDKYNDLYRNIFQCLLQLHNQTTEKKKKAKMFSMLHQRLAKRNSKPLPQVVKILT